MLAILQARAHGGCSQKLCLCPSIRPRRRPICLLPVFVQAQEDGLTAIYIGDSEGRKVIREDGVEMIIQLFTQMAFINSGECWQCSFFFQGRGHLF